MDSYCKPTHAMTIDVEDYFHVAALSSVISTSDWDDMPTRVDENTRRILDVFDKVNVKATFFVLGWVAERFPKLVKEIQQRNHEIASHGYSHQLIYNQSHKVFKQETLIAKDRLEQITGQPVTGYRAASYSITHQSLWALEILTEAGFKWDSSIFPIYHDTYGIPGTPEQPYQIQTENGLRIKEFPITTCRFGKVALPVAGGGYFRQYPYWFFKALYKRSGRKSPNMFYMHPWEIDPDQPRFTNANWLSRFRHYRNLEICESRFTQLLSDFNFGTVSNILDHPADTEVWVCKSGTLLKQGI